MRNRNLAVLPHSGLRLQRLLVGHPNQQAGIQPCITNEVPQSLSRNELQGFYASAAVSQLPGLAGACARP